MTKEQKESKKSQVGVTPCDCKITREYVDAVMNAAMIEGLHGLNREKDAARFIRKVSGAIMYAGGDEKKLITDQVRKFIYTCFTNNIVLDCKLESNLL